MKPATEAFLRKAQTLLARAQELLDSSPWPDEVGRMAYMAAFHAAQAMLFETEGRRFKTHLGVHGAFGLLVRDDPRFTAEQKKLLGRTYELKNTADYEVDGVQDITNKVAIDALAAARGFVATVASVLDQAS